MMRSTASHQRFQGQKKKERRKPCIILFGDRARVAARINIQPGKDSLALLKDVDTDTARQPHRHYRLHTLAEFTIDCMPTLGS